MIKKALILLVALSLAGSAQAQYAYNGNIKTKIESVITYTSDTLILFTAGRMPSVSGCSGNYFVITSDSPVEARQQAYSRLLAAYSSGEAIEIGYDSKTCNPSGYIVVFRVG